ncbi:MAG: GTPase domain-containing protein, partial [Planctomycetaceae bacterium]|nr:GTPase domain-containing protein [Planctomycetaceae bacterium]
MTPAAATTYATWSENVKVLCRSLAALEPLAARFGVPAPAGNEWHELLVHKLLPQVDSEPWLVVAVVGGTNIGKSVVFNHLAGEDASGVSPLAAGTKHPVCLVPRGFADRRELARLFEGFELVAWRSSEDPLGDAAENRLFWREGPNVPPRLLILDTPDIDSDVPVNWQRADAVRHVADVLVAVLTQQKYNDAAVKQFFRKAVEADKPVIVVFNQCDLSDDRAV